MKVQLDIPRIETDRLILRGFKEQDVDAIASIYADEDTARFIGGIEPEFQVWRRVAGVLGHWVLRGFGMFCVEEKASCNIVGFCGPWRPMGWPDNEIGYAFDKSVHGRGYATEAASASLRFAYEKLSWKTAIATIDPQNKASQGVARKLGAVLDQADVQINDFIVDIWRYPDPKIFMEQHA